IVFAPNPVTLPDGRIAASTGAFTLEFLVNPNAPLDPKIDALLANNAFFASQGLFGLDLSKAVSVSALEESRNPLPAWLHFDPATLSFTGSPPPDFVGALPVRIDVAGDGVNLPSFSILTDVVVDPSYKFLDAQHFDAGSFSAVASPNVVTLHAPNNFNGELAVAYT